MRDVARKKRHRRHLTMAYASLGVLVFANPIGPCQSMHTLVIASHKVAWQSQSESLYGMPCASAGLPRQAEAFLAMTGRDRGRVCTCLSLATILAIRQALVDQFPTKVITTLPWPSFTPAVLSWFVPAL